MKRLSQAVVVVLIVVVLAACASVDEVVTREVMMEGDGEMVTAVSPTTLPDTPTPTATSVPSRTPVPTDVPLPTLFATVTRTPEPSSTPCPSATPRPTIDFSTEVTWSNEVHLTHQFPGYRVEWSPASNDFVYIVEGEEGLDAVNLASLPHFQPIDIMLTELAVYSVSCLWHPSGKYLILDGDPADTDKFGYGRLSWKVDQTGNSTKELGTSYCTLGWLNDELCFSQNRVGTGWNGISIFNIVTEERIANTGFEGSVKGASENYVILNEELGYSYNTSAAILAQEVVSPEYEGWEYGTYIKFLSWRFDESKEKPPFNRFADILPGTDQVLVTTWGEGIFEPVDLISGTVQANLQLWDVVTGTLTMVAPGGIYGRYSPNGRYLVYLTPETESLQLHLLDQTTREILFTQSAFAKVEDYSSAEVKAYTTFSPNGRFLTFFNPAHELIIYDLENSEFLAPVTAVPTTPLWSPDGSRFVYQDPAAGLSIYDTRRATAHPLAISGSDRLLDPQWSFDGTYLSVTILQENWWEQETAVLQIP